MSLFICKRMLFSACCRLCLGSGLCLVLFVRSRFVIRWGRVTCFWVICRESFRMREKLVKHASLDVGPEYLEWQKIDILLYIYTWMRGKKGGKDVVLLSENVLEHTLIPKSHLNRLEQSWQSRKCPEKSQKTVTRQQKVVRNNSNNHYNPPLLLWSNLPQLHARTRADVWSV